MNGTVRRALCAVAGLLAFAGAAAVAAPVATPFTPFQSPAALAFGTSAAMPELSNPGTNVTTSASLITGLDLEAGYKVDLAGRIAPIDMSDTHAFDGLFLSAASFGMPYTALTGGGDYAGASADLARNLRFGIGVQNLGAGARGSAPDAYTALANLGGQPAPYAPRSADALVAGLSWDPAKWASFGLTAVQADERNAILGNDAPGAVADTTALGVSARVHFGSGWSTTASYSEGISQLDLKSGFAPMTADTLHSRAYGIAIAKNGLFGDDTLGLAVSQQPLGAQGGFVTMPGDAAGGTTSSFFARNHLLEGGTPETDVEVGYITTFLDGSLALQTNASFQMNYAGQTGANAVSLLSRARIKF
jgi:hypothetical protein